MTQQAPPPAGMPTPQPYHQPYHQPYGAPGQPYAMPSAAPPRTSGLAIGAFVAAFVVPVVGLILGVVARKQIARSGEGGRGLATAAIWIGAALTALGILFGVLIGVAIANAVPTAPADVVATEMASKAELPAGSVTCPGPLSGTPGTTMTCTATTADGPVSLDATVTGFDNDVVNFDILIRR